MENCAVNALSILPLFSHSVGWRFFSRVYNVTFSTFTVIAVRTVVTLGPIMARRAGALINVNLTHFPSEACGQKTHIQYQRRVPSTAYIKGFHDMIHFALLQFINKHFPSRIFVKLDRHLVCHTGNKIYGQLLLTRGTI